MHSATLRTSLTIRVGVIAALLALLLPLSGSAFATPQQRIQAVQPHTQLQARDLQQRVVDTSGAATGGIQEGFLRAIEWLRHHLSGQPEGTHPAPLTGQTGTLAFDASQFMYAGAGTIQILFKKSNVYICGFIKDNVLYWLGEDAAPAMGSISELVGTFREVVRIRNFNFNYPNNLADRVINSASLSEALGDLTRFAGTAPTEVLKRAVDGLAVMLAETARFTDWAVKVANRLADPTGWAIGAATMGTLKVWDRMSRAYLQNDGFIIGRNILTHDDLAAFLALTNSVNANRGNGEADSDFTGHLTSASGTLAADVDNADTTPGTRVKALPSKEGLAQTWTAQAADDGLWQFVSRLDGNRVLGHSRSSEKRHQAQLVEKNSSDRDQLWNVVDAGDGWATMRNGDRCLTATGSDSTLTVEACYGAKDGQKWKVPGVRPAAPTRPLARSGALKGIADMCLSTSTDSSSQPARLGACSKKQVWTLLPSGAVTASGKCLDVDHGGDSAIEPGRRAQLYGCNGSVAQEWVYTGQGELVNPHANLCLDVPGSDAGKALQLYGCNDSSAQRWTLARADSLPDEVDAAGDAGDPFDDAADDRGRKPVASGDCRPEGMTPTQGVGARYCDVYDNAGREWVGNNRTRRVVGYFTGWRTGAKGDPRYLASNIPWSKVTHINYAFARLDGNRISIGDESDPNNAATGMTWPGEKNAMDPSLPYKGHFNLLNKYKKAHPAVKTLISVGGWTDTRGFYEMTTKSDGGVNQDGINAFADSVAAFLDKYGFNGVDIDYEYPTALPSTGNPNDWEISNSRRAGLQKSYVALMKTLRERLDTAGADKGRYYLLTSAGSSSGYLTRGLDAGQALRYQDFVNVMTYDLHGSWNKYVGPQAPLFDDGRDNELAAAGIYDTGKNPEYSGTGYFNTDWAYHYYRGVLPPSRINLGIPYYSRGWRNVSGGVGDGLWGESAMANQADCPKGTGGRGPAGAQACGLGAVGIDNIWHDLENGKELGAGSNPLWHTKNLADGRMPGYVKSYGIDPTSEAGKLTGGYAEKYSDALKSPWLWNDAKKVFLSTENETSIKAKAQYIADKGVGGAMMWELGGDYTKRASGEWGMGYDLTTLLDGTLKGAGSPVNATGGGKSLPSQVIDVAAELVDFPASLKDMWPIQPKLRITNNSKVTLAQGTEISFDIPTSTSPLVKDGSWKKLDGITPGHTGSNAGGLKGDFHRVTLTLGYCEDVPAGKSKDIDLKYYLPITGPSNITFKIADKTFGSTGDQRREVSLVDPPAADTSKQCRAAAWGRHAYNPNPSFAFWQTGDKWMIEDRNSGNVLDHPGSWSDAHLVDKQDGNTNQLWTVAEDGGSNSGWYHIKSSSSGHDQCLGAPTARATLSVRDCDGKVDQWWRLAPPSTDKDTEGKPLLGQTVTGGPAHKGTYALVGYTDGTNWYQNPAYLAAPQESNTSPGTKIIAGDLNGTWASTVSWNGSYWRTKWWNKATDEPGNSDAWQKLSPTP
ncbi:glycosyl hydrolase family 18 protein [Streptomyces melanogenes]|uniref:glycosyl hydrolase family 18 protein n=1 Tax=Streptomyces melanogenes TaxID=67326 RepID=UPI00167E08A0|nr:glycosyl hydrolase family 18 protein [Streptomyces melanogenes]